MRRPRREGGRPLPNPVYTKPRTKRLAIRLSFKDFKKMADLAGIMGLTPKKYVEFLVKDRLIGPL